MGVTSHSRTLATQGNGETVFELASVTKVLAAVAFWVAVEEETIALEEPLGPPGSTVAHLLAHASGLGPDSEIVLADPGTRRIYSNAGFELLASHVSAAAEMDFSQYLYEAVTQPLGMTWTRLHGTAAHGAHSCLTDLLALARELLSPRLVHRSTLAQVATPAWPDLDGVLPGYGRQAPNTWGLGVEIKGTKSPHWTAPSAAPDAFGHFGRAGTLLWVEPALGLAGVILTDREFGQWAIEHWPGANEALRSEGLSRLD